MIIAAIAVAPRYCGITFAVVVIAVLVILLFSGFFPQELENPRNPIAEGGL
jgi:hypothetical protein